MVLNYIKEQIVWVDDWTSNLISDIDDDECGIVRGLGTSINWEIGHIVSSKFFHALKSVLNKRNQVIGHLNGKVGTEEFFKYYFAGSDPLEKWKSRPNKGELVAYLQEVNRITIRTLEKLDERLLGENTETANPVAQTKLEALGFAFKHQMWHNGQIAMIKRIIRL